MNLRDLVVLAIFQPYLLGANGNPPVDPPFPINPKQEMYAYRVAVRLMEEYLAVLEAVTLLTEGGVAVILSDAPRQTGRMKEGFPSGLDWKETL